MIKGKLYVRHTKFSFSIGWVMVASFIVYKTNFFRELWENPHRVMFFFDIAIIGLCINIALMLYMTVYLPIAKKIP